LPHLYPLHFYGEGKGNHYLVFFSIFSKIWFKTLSQLPVNSEFQNRITSIRVQQGKYFVEDRILSVPDLDEQHHPIQSQF
jgi:hypothetical protein